MPPGLQLEDVDRRIWPGSIDKVPFLTAVAADEERTTHTGYRCSCAIQVNQRGRPVGEHEFVGKRIRRERIAQDRCAKGAGQGETDALCDLDEVSLGHGRVR